MPQPVSAAVEPSSEGESLAHSLILAQTTEQVDTTALGGRKEFEFAGVLATVPEHREQVMEFVDLHCPDEGDRIDLLVAVQEALANAALHGCHDDASRLIRCVVSATATDITISVRDPGPGFPMDRADPEKYQVTKLSHGRGIVLIRSLVDEVSFAHNGAEIVLRKHLAQKSD